MNKLIKNTKMLFVLLFLCFIIISFLNFESLAFFCAVGYLTSQFTKNMNVIMITSIISVLIFDYRIREGTAGSNDIPVCVVTKSNSGKGGSKGFPSQHGIGGKQQIGLATPIEKLSILTFVEYDEKNPKINYNKHVNSGDKKNVKIVSTSTIQKNKSCSDIITSCVGKNCGNAKKTDQVSLFDIINKNMKIGWGHSDGIATIKIDGKKHKIVPIPLVVYSNKLSGSSDSYYFNSKSCDDLKPDKNNASGIIILVEKGLTTRNCINNNNNNAVQWHTGFQKQTNPSQYTKFYLINGSDLKKLYKKSS